MADAQKLQSDAALVKPGNKDAAKAALKADWTKLQSDFQAKHTTMQEDWQQLHSDFQAAREAKAERKQTGSHFATPRSRCTTRSRPDAAQVHEAVLAAKTAIVAARKAGAAISKGDASKVSDGAVVPQPARSRIESEGALGRSLRFLLSPSPRSPWALVELLAYRLLGGDSRAKSR